MPVKDLENKAEAEAIEKAKAEAKAKRIAEAQSKAKESKEAVTTVELVDGLRITSGPIPPGCVRVKVLRPHDGNGPRCFYKPGEIVDIYRAYYIQQSTPTDADGRKWEVTPPVFELVK